MKNREIVIRMNDLAADYDKLADSVASKSQEKQRQRENSNSRYQKPRDVESRARLTYGFSKIHRSL
jgi:hypothetical protein